VKKTSAFFHPANWALTHMLMPWQDCQSLNHDTNVVVLLPSDQVGLNNQMTLALSVVSNSCFMLSTDCSAPCIQYGNHGKSIMVLFK
jgi:hypothetical protein